MQYISILNAVLISSYLPRKCRSNTDPARPGELSDSRRNEGTILGARHEFRLLGNQITNIELGAEVFLANDTAPRVLAPSSGRRIQQSDNRAGPLASAKSGTYYGLNSRNEGEDI